LGLNQKIKQLKDIQGIEIPFDTNAAWQGIEGALNNADNRRKAIWWYSVASVLVLFSIIGVGLYFHLFNEPVNTTQNVEIAKPVQKSESNTPQLSNTISDEIVDNNPISQLIPQPSKTKKEINSDKDKINSPKENWAGKIAGNYFYGFDWFLVQAEMFNLPISREIKTIKETPKPFKLSIELFASATPSIVNKMVKSDGQLGWLVNKDFNSISGKSEFATAGIQANLGIQFNLSPKWFVQTGLSYSEKREWVRYNHTLTEFTIVRESQKTLEYAPLSPQQWVNIDYEGNNSYKFLEIPLLVGTSVQLASKWDWKIRGGLSYWRLIGKSGEKLDPTYLTLNNLSTLKYYRNNSIGIQLNSGVYYNLNKNWSLMAEPGASLSLSNLTKGSPVNTKPYNYGLNLGVQYKLK